jgi:glycosyltransferase involved in cell wall biosynthesis
VTANREFHPATEEAPSKSMQRAATFRSRLSFAWHQHFEPRLLGMRVHHVAGPERVPHQLDQVLAICVVRNGALHLRSFVEHHLRLGVHHIVFLDNGSTDNTVELASAMERVTVLRTDAPYQRFENTMKRYLARRFSTGRWNLCVDIDERFDYPGSDMVPLPDLLRYLRNHRYTALVAHMLDLAPDCTLAELDASADEPPDQRHVYYDLSNIRKQPYRWGELSSDEIRMHWDGIRNSLFGFQGALTKAPLVFVRREMDLFSGWHHSRRAHVADIAGLLLHYPFAGGFAEKVRDAVETGRYGKVTTGEYERYWKALRTSGEFSFLRPTSKRWRGMDALVEEEFLVVSDQYRSWIAARGSTNTASQPSDFK